MAKNKEKEEGKKKEKPKINKMRENSLLLEKGFILENILLDN